MRTSIFSNFADLPREFMEDFAALWNLPEDQRLALIRLVSELSRVELTGETRDIRDRGISEISGNASELLRALKSLQFISKAWNPLQDKPEDFLKDLNELSLVPSEKAEEGKRFLLDFFGEIQKDNLRRLQKLYANMVLPSLESFSTLVDFRAVFDNPYRWSDNVEAYEPRCIDYVPVIVVHIGRDSGDPESFDFQCEPDDIRFLISALQATLKEIESGKLSFSRGIK